MRLLILLLISFFCLAGASRGATIVVSKSGPVGTIKQAIAKAKTGDVILIKKGVYKEGEITIDKAITLQGEDLPVLDGNGTNQILTVTVSGVTIKGLHLRNTGTSSLNDLAGIKLLNVAHVTISDNKLEDCFFGIYLSKSDSCIVTNNHVSSGSHIPETMLGNGIHMWKCSDVLVENNLVQGQRDGIYLEFTTKSTIRKNTTEKNIRYGLHFMFSHDVVYTFNTFRDNGAGVAVMYTDRVEMTGNLFELNWGSSAYGLLLKDINGSTIRNNTFRKNTTALYMEGSNRIKVESNNFENNGWAIKLLANCMEDTFRLNNFTANTFDVASNGTTMLNHINANYWDKYSGYDLDKDKVGDVPYRPVSLYSVMVEKVPYSVMFLRSFVVDLMDQMEKVIPSFTPELLIDNQPAMAYFKGAGAQKFQPETTPANTPAQTIVIAEASNNSTFSKLLGFVKNLFTKKDIQAPAATGSPVVLAAGH